MNNLDFLKQLVEKTPNDCNALYLLAQEYSKQGFRDDALQTLARALPFAEGEAKRDILNEISKISAGERKVNVVGKINDDDTALAGENPFRHCGLDPQSHQIAGQARNDEKDACEDEDTDAHATEKSRVLHLYKLPTKTPNSSPTSPEIDFSQVGGLTELKNIIDMRIIKPFVSPHLYNKFMKKTGGGLLLYGPPGCGKTFIAKATAGECRAQFKSVKISDILDPYLGQSERNIADIFSTARMNKPCVLFFDEIDTLGYSRSKTSSDRVRSIVDSMLTEMEGIDTSTDKMLIIGATNMPWDVDPALRRPGRFDRAVFVAPPDEEARKVIFELKLKNRPCENININILAKATPLFSGADIEHVAEQAAETVLENIFKTGDEDLMITQDILAQTIAETKPSTIEWLRTISSYIRYSNQAGFYDDVEKYLAVSGVRV